MKHDFMKNRDSLINFMIITSCHKVLKEFSAVDRKDSMYNIVLTIDGIEMDFEQFMKRWQENVEHKINAKAKEIVDETLGTDSINDIYESIEKFHKHIDSVVEKAISTKIEDENSRKI